MFLANEFEFNMNTYTSKIAGNSKCIDSRAHGIKVISLQGFLGENQKGTAGRGREKKVTTICDKRHDNLRHFRTTCDIL